jgi:hypothetical protein
MGQDGPMNRGRRNAKSRRSDLRIVRPVQAVPEECDCPACSDPDSDPQAFIADLAESAAEILALDEPLEAELFGAGVVAAGRMTGEDFMEALANGIVPALAQLSTPGAVGALAAIGAVERGSGAADAARRLVAGGLPAPVWMTSLDEQVKAGICRRYSDPAGVASMLLCTFERSGRSHGFLVQVDHTECDAAADIMLFPGEALDQLTSMIQEDGRQAGTAFDTEELDPAEFRWQAERAIDARAVHDEEDGFPLPDEDADEDGVAYHALAVVLRSRLEVLPEPSRPPAEHGSGDGPVPMPALEM